LSTSTTGAIQGSLGVVEQIKAVSQNLMHANFSVTDGVYGILSGMDVKGEITELGKKEVSSEVSEIAKLNALIEQFLLERGQG
jgi:hypothetical protein